MDNSANKFKNITTNGNTVVTESSELVSLVINTKGASSNTATIYKGTSENPNMKIGTVNTTVDPGRFDYGIACPSGFLVVTATGTAPDITLIYRPL